MTLPTTPARAPNETTGPRPAVLMGPVIAGRDEAARVGTHQWLASGAWTSRS
jgi:hypothetical protein